MADADYEFLLASNGSGDAALAHVNGSGRLTGATTIPVDTVTNFPTKFIGTYGVLGANGRITSASKRDFKGHVSGGNIVIDGFLPGSVDAGNAAGDVVIIKPNTHWTNKVAQFIRNATGFGTPEAVGFAALAATAISAASAVLSGNLTVGGNASVTGNVDISGTSRLIPATTVTVDGSGNITPSKQNYSVTALNAAAQILAPTWGAADMMSGVLKIKDDGTSRALTWASGWVEIGVTKPSSTIAGKWMYVSYEYNAADSKFHIVGISRQS